MTKEFNIIRKEYIGTIEGEKVYSIQEMLKTSVSSEVANDLISSLRKEIDIAPVKFYIIWDGE